MSTSPHGYKPFLDYIPEGEEMDRPAQGLGNLQPDFVPESVHCTDGRPVEPDTMPRGVVKRRKMRGDGTIIPSDE